MEVSSKPRKYRKKSIKPQVKPEKVSVESKVPLMLLQSVNYVYPTFSGERVVWSGAGSIISVSRKDADFLLTKTQAGGCCGPKNRNPTFKEM